MLILYSLSILALTALIECLSHVKMFVANSWLCFGAAN